MSGPTTEEVLTAAVEQVVVELPDDFSMTRPVPLNSRKMTTTLVKAVATALELPGTGSKEETLQMIEGKLGDEGFDSPNVQVSIVISEEDRSELSMQLVAAQGVFLQVGLRKAEDTGSEESGDGSSEGTEPVSGPVRD